MSLVIPTPTSEPTITEIRTVSELAAINGYGHFRLMADINVTGSWIPINNFAGTFDGNNHIITGLNNSLFGTLFGPTIIQNVHLRDGTDNLVNHIIGLDANVIIRNSSVHATIGNTGGIIGTISDNRNAPVIIENTHFYGAINIVADTSITLAIGGIVGSMYRQAEETTAIIRNSTAEFTLNLTRQVGGSSVESYIGGIVGRTNIDGENTLQIENTMAVATINIDGITNNMYVGGAIGDVEDTAHRLHNVWTYVQMEGEDIFLFGRETFLGNVTGGSGNAPFTSWRMTEPTEIPENPGYEIARWSRVGINDEDFFRLSPLLAFPVDLVPHWVPTGDNTPDPGPDPDEPTDPNNPDQPGTGNPDENENDDNDDKDLDDETYDNGPGRIPDEDFPTWLIVLFVVFGVTSIGVGVFFTLRKPRNQSGPYRLPPKTR